MTESDECVPSDIEEIAEKALGNVLPVKSKERYEAAYIKYQKWCQTKGVKSLTNEKVLLAYFSDLCKIYSAASIWTFYSMIRLMLSLKNNVDISKYTLLVAFVKRNSDNYQPKKSKVFSKYDVSKFLIDAQDDKYLFMKAALIIGLSGACRKQEMTDLLIENVKDNNDCFCFYLPSTKTKTSREFVVSKGNIPGVNLVEIIRKYANLRPNHTNHDRFFVQYKDKKCTIQPVGKNTFGSLSKNVASYLKLDSPQLYTGHCLRRSSASLLADLGAVILTLKCQGGWNSSAVAEGSKPAVGFYNSEMEKPVDEDFKCFDDTAAFIYNSSLHPTTPGLPKDPFEEDNKDWFVKAEVTSPVRDTSDVDQNTGLPLGCEQSVRTFIKAEVTSPGRDSEHLEECSPCPPGLPKQPCEVEWGKLFIKTEATSPDRDTSDVDQDPDLVLGM